MRIVVDTNILISGIFFGGRPREFLQHCYSGNLQMVCTEEIFIEYIETIEKLSKKSGKGIPDEIKAILIEHIEFIENRYADRYCRDPHDDKFINCARSGEITHIVSGDNDLLILKDIRGIRISKVADFLENIRE